MVSAHLGFGKFHANEEIYVLRLGHLDEVRRAEVNGYANFLNRCRKCNCVIEVEQLVLKKCQANIVHQRDETTVPNVDVHENGGFLASVEVASSTRPGTQTLANLLGASVRHKALTGSGFSGPSTSSRPGESPAK